MRAHKQPLLSAAAALCLIASHASARQTNNSRIGPDGTAYVTRVVPVPATISPEAQKMLARVVSDAAVPQTLQQRRDGTDRWQAGVGEASKKLYPVQVKSDTLAGVPVRIITPLTIAPGKTNCVLINLPAVFRMPANCQRYHKRP